MRSLNGLSISLKQRMAESLQESFPCLLHLSSSMSEAYNMAKCYLTINLPEPKIRVNLIPVVIGACCILRLLCKPKFAALLPEKLTPVFKQSLI